MKTIALIAATGSLAAFTVPATAAELPLGSSNAVTAPAGLTVQFDQGYGVEDASYDRYRDRRHRGHRGRGHDRYRDRDYRDRAYDRHGRYYEPRRISRRDRVWRGRDGNYYCERGNGTTGLVIGAGVGALAGRAIDTRGDRTVGTLLGAIAGGLLGREIDRGELRCR